MLYLGVGVCLDEDTINADKRRKVRCFLYLPGHVLYPRNGPISAFLSKVE